MEDLNKIYYLDKNPDSKRNIPFDGNFRLLFVKGFGQSITEKIGWWDEYLQGWYLCDEITQVHPVGWAYYKKWVEEK